MSYELAGVGYRQLDALKRFAQIAASETSGNLPTGMKDVISSMGESARVIDIGSFYLAMVEEGLGTKNIVAEEYTSVREDISYENIGYDTVAMIVNDLLVVGAKPIMVNAHWALGGSKWLENPTRGADLARGWKQACNDAGAVYGAGETAILKGIIYPNTIELSGSVVGIIEPKNRLTLGEKLQAGDHIVLVESNGIHANGITLVRKIADELLPTGYHTILPSGRTLGETLLKPTHIYASLQQKLFKAGLDIHYMVHLTGHGWRKFMRADRDFTYRMHTVPEPREEFQLIQKIGNISDEEMYATFNMGAGFAFFVSAEHVQSVSDQASALDLKSWDAGIVENGPKQVIIEPVGVRYAGDTLRIR